MAAFNRQGIELRKQDLGTAEYLSHGSILGGKLEKLGHFIVCFSKGIVQSELKPKKQIVLACRWWLGFSTSFTGFFPLLPNGNQNLEMSDITL